MHTGKLFHLIFIFIKSNNSEKEELLTTVNFLRNDLTLWMIFLYNYTE